MHTLTYLHQYTYLAIFILNFLGNLGFPFPEEVIFIIAGYLASIKAANLWIILLVSIASIIITNNLSFFAGRFFGRPILKFLCKRKSLNKLIHKTDNFFHKHGKKTIILTRFVWNIRNWIPLLAGSSKIKWKDFQKYDLIGILIYTPILVFLGFFFGKFLEQVIGAVNEIEMLIFIFFLILVGFYLLRIFYSKFTNGN